jgi:hypothetical protein
VDINTKIWCFSVTYNQELTGRSLTLENERLPTELGWNVREEVVAVEAILRISDMIGEATSLLTADSDGAAGSNCTKKAPRRGFHAGVRRDL